MPGPTSIEGYAIVSEDGMLADAERRIPPALMVEADQKFFHGSLEHAAVVVHGRHSHEGGPRADSRHRLVVTRRVPALAPYPKRPKTLLWNPQGASLEEAWARLGAPDGMLAVIGGPDVNQIFLDRGYRRFPPVASRRRPPARRSPRLPRHRPTARRKTCWRSTGSSRRRRACSIRPPVRRW